MRIWKFSLQIADEQALHMPRLARILDVQMQDGIPQLWALCDETLPAEPRNIVILGTGNPIQYDGQKISRMIYVGTFQMLGGEIVYHVFDLGVDK